MKLNMPLLKYKSKQPSVEELMKKQLNLYPYKNGRLNSRQQRTRIYAGLAAALIVLLTSYSAYLYVQNKTMMNEIAVRSANLQIEKERLYNQQMLDELMKRIDYKSTLLQYIDKTNASATLVIDTIERNVPNEIQYINLDFISENTIRISCQTTDQEWIAKLVHQLKLENFFDDVFVESIVLHRASQTGSPSDEYEFQLICTFGGTTDETQK